MATPTADLFLARQPIVDRSSRVVAYELLHRNGQCNTAQVTDDAAATAQVLSRAFKQIGIATVLGPCRGFINVDAEMLFDPRIEALPRSSVVLEILETVVPDEHILHRCAALKQRGFRLALDDFCTYSDAYAPLLDLVDIVKVDILQTAPAALEALVAKLRLHRTHLLAEKVESHETMRRCLSLGFDLFQGFLCGRPALL